MKKPPASIISIFSLLALSSCTSELYQASWQTKEIVVDGIPTEWSLPLRFSDPKSGLQYNITNDETNLYVCVRATERPAQMKILGSGMVIWLDPSGKNKENVGINFPLPVKHEGKPEYEDFKADPSQGAKKKEMSLERDFELLKPQIMLSGFLPEYNGTFEADQAKGAKAAINWDDQDNMTYELAIPFHSFLARDINALKDNPVIGILIEVAAFKRPQASGAHGGEGSGQRHGGMEGGGMQGGPGGGFGGGHGGGHGGGLGESHQASGGNAYSSMNEPTAIKFKIKLKRLENK